MFRFAVVNALSNGQTLLSTCKPAVLGKGEGT